MCLYKYDNTKQLKYIYVYVSNVRKLLTACNMKNYTLMYNGKKQMETVRKRSLFLSVVINTQLVCHFLYISGLGNLIWRCASSEYNELTRKVIISTVAIHCSQRKIMMMMLPTNTRRVDGVVV